MIITRKFSTYSKLSQKTSSNSYYSLINSLASSFKRAPKIASSTSYKSPTPPIGVPISKILSNTFPLSIKDSFDDYKLRHGVLKFQDDLLSTLPFYPDADPRGRTSQVLQVNLDDEGENFINEFVIYPPGKTEADSSKLNHLILLHGYGAGLGFYLKNFSDLSTRPNWCIHAIDLLGYGCSSRPTFNPGNTLKDIEKWFHESFHKWKLKRGLTDPSKILVAAHSMGAYLTATYSINYPNQFQKLLMISPGAVIPSKRKVKVPGWFEMLWERNISPFSVIRNAGPFGSYLTSGWTSRRFSKLSKKEHELLHKYTYGIFSSKGSGEYMLNYLLAPGAEARYPLIDRIQQINCDMTWVYGENDWMDKRGGSQCSDVINGTTRYKSDVVEIENAGHHVYLDNYRSFNRFILTEMNKFE